VDAISVASDLLGPTATEDPYALFAELREREPVCWSEAHRAWLVSRYADVAAAFQNKRLSSDRVRPMLAARAAGGVPAAADEILSMMSEWMVLSDPPAHTRLRRLAAGAFRGQRIAALEGRIGELVDGFLDGFVAGGHRDLIEHVAYPLPATVIAEMLGAPAADRDRFRLWSGELGLVAFGAGGDARPDRHERALGGLREMFEYFTELAEIRRAAPTGDMLSALLQTEGPDGAALRPDELVGMCSLLLFAGHETTTNSIANGVLSLLRHPDQLARLRRHPELIPSAVEELLRIEGPIKTLVRWVLEDHELGGRTIRNGERVYLLISSANRDPDRFAEPERLDLGRAPNPHIAFGRGVHACIGAQLARIEMRVALGRILDRLPELALTDDQLTWNCSLASRSLAALPVSHRAPR
jgi:cytochrome P450